MTTKNYGIGSKVLVSDFVINGVKFAERFPGVIVSNNGDGTYVVRITVRNRVATTTVSGSSILVR